MKRIIIIVGVILFFGFLFSPPVQGGKLTSWYGIRLSGLGGFWHPGTDIGHYVGAPVTSVGTGTVTRTGNEETGRGLFIDISHYGVFQSRYYHLDSIAVAAGEKVGHKTQIGTVGNTGFSTGPHLHYEIRLIGIPLPPHLITRPGIIVNMFR